ncbi:MAG: chloride channel protein [Gemmatimonadales bacterium]
MAIVRLSAWQRRLTARFSDRAAQLVGGLGRLGVDETTLLLGFALAVGSAVGLAVIVFYRLIDAAQATSLAAAGRLTGLGSLSIVLVVLAGLAVTRLIVVHGTGDSDGENIPSVMRAVAKEGGVIHTLPVAVKTAGTAVVIGASGSVGAEGPVAVAGSALGSKFGRLFRSGPERLRLLVACGAAAGISAAFNAPIAGVFFSLEKVVGSFAVSAFPPILVSSVVAAAIARAAFGDTPVIAIPREYGVGSASELVFYALLGVVTGVVAVLYTRSVYRAQDMRARIPSILWQLVLAGLVVGGLNVVFKASLWGRGHEAFSLQTVTDGTAFLLVGLAFAKMVGTAATVAATRVGGLFTPALFIGATLAGGLALAAGQLLPGFTIAPEAFALVGMAGLVAGSMHAPLTAIMMVFEMTSDYALILPLMLCGAIAYITARRIHPESIYSEWLARRGESIHAGRDAQVLEGLPVRDAFDSNPHVIGENATVQQILQAIRSSRQTEFPVLDGDLRLVGMITYDDLRAVLSDPGTFAPLVVAHDLASSQFERVTPADSLSTALKRLALRGSHYVPVVDERDPDRLLGLIGRQEILTAYDRELLAQR